MQKCFEIEQGVSEKRGFKWLEMILLHETKKRKKILMWGARMHTSKIIFLVVRK